MLVIDSHAHIYPEKIAEKATLSIGQFYDIKMKCVGSIANLLQSGNEINVEKYIVHSVAIAKEKVITINDFVSQSCKEHNKFIGFATLHPNMTKSEIEQEIARAIGLGLVGIKLHPDIQTFAIDGEKAQAIYDVNNARLPILLHTGDKRYSFSNPWRLASIAKKFPTTTFIGAHFGGFSEWDSLDCYLQTPNVYFDTSSSLFLLEKKKAANLITKLGAHRFFFATDFPITPHIDELKRFLSLPLTTKVQENILYHNVKNAMRF